MNPAEMVVAIILIVMIARVLQARYRYSDRANRPDPAEAQENRQLRQEVQALRDRVQVLERVITDNHSSSDLDREIEKLRDRS